MQRLKLEDGQLQPRGEVTVGRIEVVPNTRNLGAEPLKLRQVEVVVLNFPSFKDGRAFSQARALREQGFEGDIRATGGLFRDQIGFAIRCGFTSFDLETDDDLEGLRVSAGRFAHAYQRPGPTGPAWEARK